MADSVETLGVDLRTRVKKLGAKEQARRKKCRLRFSIIKKSKAFQKNYMKMGVKKLLRAGLASKNLGSTCSGFGLCRKIEIEEADGSSSGQKEYDLFVLVHGSIWPRSRGGTFHFGHSVLRRGSPDRKMAS